jgi:hypothetical protein
VRDELGEMGLELNESKTRIERDPAAMPAVVALSPGRGRVRVG